MCLFLLAKPSGSSLEQPVRLQIKDHADNGLRVGFLFCLEVSNLTITLRKAAGFEQNLFQGCIKLVSSSIVFLFIDYLSLHKK